jgi:ketosteroid isomerase-like protein
MSRALALLLLGIVSTVSPAQSGKKRSASDELIALEQRWTQAMVTSDQPTLGRILADAYIDTDESGQRSTKSDLLAVLKSGDLKVQEITLSDMRIHEYGSAAVVTGSATQKGSYKGQSFAPKVVFTDTFVRTPTGWRAVASQRTAAP